MSFDRRNPLCPGRDRPACTRRAFLSRSGMGFGALALLGLAHQEAQAGGARTHFPARARRVLFLFMAGGVSHVDSFDYKPELARRNGQPAVWRADALSQATSANRRWLGNQWEFRRRGQSGLWVSDLFPNIARVADEL